MKAMRSDQDVDIDLGALFRALRRDWRRIFAVTAAVAVLALAFAFLATPQYRGETRILIETRESVFTRPDANRENSSPILDEEGVTSQVEVISSTDLLKQVADRFHLADRDEFDAGTKPSLVGRALIALGLKSDESAFAREDRVLKIIREKLKVYRVEKSRVIVVEFSSQDPQLAADVPNAIADAYIGLQREAKLQSNADATGWLEPEIADLRRKVKDAEAKVADFRAHADLLVGQNNSVLATQQLSELATELSRVRAARAAAEAKATSVRAALKSGVALDSVPDVLSSGLIQRLREKQVQLAADLADLSTSLLDNHPRIKALRSQMADLNDQIRNEARKVLQSLETQAATARLREQELTGEVNRLKVVAARAGGQEVELRALEREAASQRELLESYLTRYREAASRTDRNYLPADARIFSRANVPAEPYFPKLVPILGAAIAASLLIMCMITLLSELFSGRAMRPAGAGLVEPVVEVEMPAPPRAPATLAADQEVERDSERTVVEAVDLEPAEENDAARAEISEAGASITEASPGEPLPAKQVVAVPEPATIPEQADAEADPAEARQVQAAGRPGQLTIDAAAERLISSGASRAIIVSPEGDEAAATAVLIAREVADAGLRVLLLDLTASGAASRPMLDGAGRPGITNLLAAEAQFTDVIHADHYSQCHVIPVGTADAAKAMRAADRLPIILTSLSTAYDLVVVECGPAEAAGIRRLMGEGAAVLVSFIQPDEKAVEEAEAELKAGGFKELMLVTPTGARPPTMPDRSAA